MIDQVNVGSTSTAQPSVPSAKAALLARRRITLRKVTFPMSGETLHILDLSYSRRQALLAMYEAAALPLTDEPRDPVAERMNNIARNDQLSKSVVLECVRNEDGTPFFEEADWAELTQDGDGLLIGEVMAEVMGALSAKKVKDAGNASAQTPSDASSSA